MISAEKEFIRVFRETQPKFSRFYACLLGQEGLTLSQYAVLSELAAAGKPLAMTALSKKLHITKPAVTNLADKLEEHCFAARRPHPSDRRVQLLEIKAPGLKAVKRTQNAVLKVLLDSFSKLNAAGQGVLTCFYSDISASMDAVLKGAEKCL
ncbi:MAG: MarR family transcriptional regulator [Candidatus Omnitrophica bacterium]|nr:MarR family transcriptional regulator [Candidatus Omnitrophota bacterium]